MDRDLNHRQPYYALIAEELMREIREGRFPPGTLIPTEPELCRRFGVSRVTVRGALRELEVRGMITRRRGVGTRVETVDTQSRFVHDTSSVEEILLFPSDLEFRLLDRREIQIDDALAVRLEARPGDRFVRIEGIRLPSGSDLPVCLSAHYVPARFADVIERMDGLKGSLAMAVAEAAQKTISEIEQVIDALNIDKREAGLLHAKARDSALLNWRKYRDDASNILLATRSIYPKDRSSYVLLSKRAEVRRAIAANERRRA
jgi:DNA-binding GntR family transcriptional regulator